MAFPPMDFNRFLWQTKPDDPSCYSRLTLGGETFLNFQSGQQIFFLGFQVTFANPISASTLLARAREAWEMLRFDVPTIAAHMDFDKDSWSASIVYHLAERFEQVQEWSERVVRLAEGTDDIDELRCELSKEELSEGTGDQNLLYILPKSDASYGFLLRAHHSIFDGAALQIIANDFLMRLANPVLNGAESLAWGTESKNLPPPTAAILCATELTEGPLYDEGLQAILASLGTIPHRLRFKERNVGLEPAKRVQLVFSEDETTKILSAIRAQGGTCNQFAHAAVCVLCYQDNPTTESTPPNAVYVTPGISNCRNRLLPQYEKHRGYALGANAIAVAASVLASSAPKGERVQLLEVAKILKAEYEFVKENHALLGCQPQLGDLFFEVMKSSPANTQPSFGFVGDGIGEKYMSRSFDDVDGKCYVALDDYFISVNAVDPEMCFRAFTWREKLRLSIDFNEHALSKDLVQGFLEKWAALLRLLL